MGSENLWLVFVVSALSNIWALAWLRGSLDTGNGVLRYGDGWSIRRLIRAESRMDQVRLTVLISYEVAYLRESKVKERRMNLWREIVIYICLLARAT